MYKLRLDDLHENVFIASKIVKKKAYSESFASNSTTVKKRFCEGFRVENNDVISIKNYGCIDFNSKMILSYTAIQDLKNHSYDK